MPDREPPVSRSPLPGLAPAAAWTLLLGLFAVLAVVATWPQAVELGSVPDLGDPLFSTWRLAWIAHQAPRDPLHLFDANIFYPEHLTFAYSDPVLVAGAMAAPLLWSGANPVVVYNVVLLAAFALSGLAMFALAWSLTSDAAAAFVAGALFTCFPFRFAHHSHLELQFAMWVPVAVWALRRTVIGGRVRDGLLAGGAIALQALSCLYYAIFLVTYLVPFWTVLAVAYRGVRRSVRPLVGGAVLATVLVAPVAWPYLANHARYGARSRASVAGYSASARDYLVAPIRGTLYGSRLSAGRTSEERELFPGVLLVALAIAGLWPPIRATRIACALGLAFAFDASLGFNGLTYRWLYEYVLPFRGLRVPARFAMLVGFSLSLLAGYGAARLLGRLRRPASRWALAFVLVTVAVAESRVALDLERVRPRPPAIYQWLPALAPGVVACLPFPAGKNTSWFDARYMYFSTFHWPTLVNGNSGFLPPSYVALLDVMNAEFPRAPALDELRRRGVSYLLVHEEYYEGSEYERIRQALSGRTDVAELRRSGVAGHEVALYRLLR